MWRRHGRRRWKSLGARALYLFKKRKKDTRYRISRHQPNPTASGKAFSSGCHRMMNQDVIDLYARVPIGASVVVFNSTQSWIGRRMYR